MAIRRPRIKAFANIVNCKRKAKSNNTATQESVGGEFGLTDTGEASLKTEGETNTQKVLTAGIHEHSGPEDAVLVPVATDANGLPSGGEKETERVIVPSSDDNAGSNDTVTPQEGTNSSFKCPSKISRVSSKTINSFDDVFYSDIEENSSHMEMEKSFSSFPMSPSKQQVRQRIKPIPIFGHRRNSLADDCAPGDFIPPFNRRERHYSGSTSNSLHSTHRAAGMGRIRTESGCSAFSDSYSVKMRKADGESHRLLARRDFENRFTNGVPDKSELKMFDLIFYNPVTNPMQKKTNITTILPDEANINNAPIIEENKSVEARATSRYEPNAFPVPQLKLDSNGELILDDKSLEIETTAQQEARKVLANSSVIIVDENTGMNGFYKRQKRTKEWTPDETVKFYRCLQTVGTDFSLMCQLFPSRNRRDLKLKFKKEERCNEALINKAIMYPKTFNIEELKTQLELEEKERLDNERKWKEIKTRMAREARKAHVNISTGARNISQGKDVLRNENIPSDKLSKRTKNQIKSNSVNQRAKSKQQNKDEVKLEAEHYFVIDNSSRKMETCSNISSSGKLQSSKMLLNELVDSQQLERDLTELLHSNIVYEDNQQKPSKSDKEARTCTIKSGRDTSENVINNKTFVNLDDGTLMCVIDAESITNATSNPASLSKSTVTNVETTTNLNNSTISRQFSEDDVDEILTKLGDGTMVLVSTLDQDNSDRVVNEIYLVDEITGELCNTPLNIPDVIVNCIMSVMS